MKTFTKLFAALLMLTLSLNPLFAQTQIGQDVGSSQNGYAPNSPSLSFDGNRMAVNERDVIKLYELINNQWVEIGSDSTQTSFISISADGNRIGVADERQGKVLEFVNGDLTQIGTDIPLSLGLYSSVSISPDGNRIALGAGGGDIVMVREWDGTDWVQLGPILHGETPFDIFGNSVSLSWDGNILAVGAPFNDGNGNSSGHVRVFEWSGVDWVQIGADIDGQYNSDEAGRSVSLSADGNRLAIGSPYHLSIGHTRVYERVADEWIQLGDNILGNSFYDNSGLMVSLSASGNTLAILSSPTTSFAGYAHVYEWLGGAWVKMSGDFVADNADDKLRFISLSGNGGRIATGILSTTDNNFGGYTRVYNSFLTLPIQLTRFQANAINKEVLLNWNTASETNNAGFDIEHSTDGTSWQMLGFERGQGTSQTSHTYTYTHETPSTGINYYRLKQVDFDGSFEYSEVVSARIYGRDGIEVFPNPTFGEIYISGIDYEELNIINILGETVFNLATPQPNIDISHLPSGTYFIQLRQGDTHFVQKVVKE